MDKFKKHDTDKTRLELIEPAFILGIGDVLTMGAKKYSAHNWKTMELLDIERIKGSLFRHQMAYMDGEEFDPESGLSHLYHVACNAMFLDYWDRHKVRDLGYDGVKHG